MKRLFVISLVLLLIAGLVIGGCGPQEQAPADPEAPAPEPAPAPAEEKEMVIAIGVEPESLDPIGMSSAVAATVSEHISQPLIYLDVDGTLKPNLAVSWEASSDGLVWTINLREGVKFHDGTPFNAEAVKFNMDRFLDPENNAPFRFLISRIVDVEAADEYTVKLHMEEPFAPMLAHLTHSFIGMISPASVEDLGKAEATETPVGTGPYKLARWDRGQQVTLERNEDYWGEVPEINSVTFKFVPEDASRLIMLETGEAQAIMRVPPSEVARLEGNPDINVVHQSGVRLIYFVFNNTKEPFDDPRVRQALNYAIDKEAIVNTILSGSGTPSTAPVVPAVFGYTKAGPYEYNPEMAKQLLADAGYQDGFSINLFHPTGRYVMDSTIAEAIQAMFKEVGVDASLQTLEWATYMEMLRKPAADSEHDMAMMGWGTVTLDSDYGLYSMFHSSQHPPTAWNISFFDNSVVNDLLEKGRTVTDVSERESIYNEAINEIWEEAPWLFLHDELQINAELKNVKGLIHHPLENIFVWDADIE